MMMPNLLHFRRLLVIISIMSARQIKIFTSRSEMILPRTMGERRRRRVPLWIVVFSVDFVFTRRTNMFLRLMKCFVVLLVYAVFERNNNVTGISHTHSYHYIKKVTRVSTHTNNYTGTISSGTILRGTQDLAQQFQRTNGRSCRESFQKGCTF